MKRKIVTNLTTLKKQSNPIKDEIRTKKIIKDLEDTLKEERTGIGLSAIQINIPVNIAIIRIPQLNYKIDLINPEIIEKEEPFRMIKEGCLSFKGIEIDTKRYKQITFMNKGQTNLEKGLVAAAIQHEIDHMRGITIFDRKWKNRR